MQANTIDEVIRLLEGIVADCEAGNKPHGIFAYVYLHTTRQVKNGIIEGRFQDGARMEMLDVIFANRYFQAYEHYRHGKSCAGSWKKAFEASQSRKLTVLQHILLGMNVHINFDLGIAAIDTMPPEKLTELESDFFEINSLLAEQINAIQEKVNAVSPLLFLMDWLGRNNDEKFAEFSVKKARSHAWNAAVRLSKLTPEEREREITELDNYVTVLTRFITEPGILAGMLVKLVRWFEEKEVKKILEKLRT